MSGLGRIDVRYAVAPPDGSGADWARTVGATADDGAEAARLAPRRRWGFLTGRGIVRTMAAALGHRSDGPLARRCPNCGSNQHGPPVLAGSGWNVAITRTEGFVAVALADQPIGIDAEAPTAVPLVGDVFSAAERAALAGCDQRSIALATEAWVAKEAVGKLTGLGLLGAASTAVGPLPPTDAWAHGVDARGAACSVRRLSLPEDVGMTVAVAARTPAPVAVAVAMGPAMGPAVPALQDRGRPAFR